MPIIHKTMQFELTDEQAETIWQLVNAGFGNETLGSLSRQLSGTSNQTNKSGAPRASAWRTLPDGRKVRKSDPLWIAHIATLASDGQDGQVEAAVAAVEATVAAPAPV